MARTAIRPMHVRKSLTKAELKKVIGGGGTLADNSGSLGSIPELPAVIHRRGRHRVDATPRG